MSTTLLEGHVLAVLEGLPEKHFHTVCTSPPYWQLRAYGTEPQVWQCEDGDALCAPEQHEWEALPEWTKGGTGQNTTLHNSAEYRQSRDTDAQKLKPGAFCARCGAWRGELGQEPTPEAFVAHLVAVFDAVRRVLRDDGTLWVNLAGSYWSEPGGQNGSQGTVSPKAIIANAALGRQKRGKHPVYKPLDWVDVPGLFARAMQAAGWLWRSDVTWVKPSALPESVQGTRWERCRVRSGRIPVAEHEAQGQKVPAAWDVGEHPHDQGSASRGRYDTEGQTMAEWADCPGCPKCRDQDGLVLRRGSGRPTKSTERLLVFALKPGYYFDQEGVREGNAESTIARLASGPVHGIGSGEKVQASRGDQGMADYTTPNGRNLRDWWVLSPEPLKDAHYAAYPSALPERCIKAGTSEWGCCPGCGAPWARVVSTVGVREQSALLTGGKNEALMDGVQRRHALSVSHGQPATPVTTTLGWRPTCRCPDAGPPVPCRVLDPFSGSGTTLLAANRLGRDATGVELKPAYNQLARKRVGREPLSLFATHGDTGGILPGEEAEGAVAGG